MTRLVLPALHANDDMTPEQLAVLINQSASTNRERTGSAVALNTDWDALVQAVDDWALGGWPAAFPHCFGQR